MRRALDLAQRGLYTSKPNPRVGCVLAQGARVIGVGAHLRAGQPHAEVHALREAGEAARGATAYVTLEPCAHYGRTPPCAHALVAAGVSRVVVAIADPFPQVNGAGIEYLRRAGIAVDCGLLADDALELNRGFFARVLRKRPWLRVKLGMSLDGRVALADGRSQWITSADARADVQRWRARSCAVVTGIGTVLADDPRLDARLPADVDVQAAERVVLDSRARLPANARLLRVPGPLLQVAADTAPPRADLAARVERLALPSSHGRLDLPLLLAHLADRSHNEVLVEAGPTLSGALIEAGLVDELVLYVAPRLLGPGGRGAFGIADLDTLDQPTAWYWHAMEPVGADLRLILRRTES